MKPTPTAVLTAFMKHFAPLEHVDTPHPEVIRLFEMGRKAMAEAN